MAGGSLSTAKISKEARIARAFELRMAGYNFRQIALQIKAESRDRFIMRGSELGWSTDRINLELSVNPPHGKYTADTARRDIEMGLKEIRTYNFEDARCLRDLECARLDQLFTAVYTSAVNGDLLALDRALKIVDMRCRILGLNTPIDLRMREIIYKQVEYQFNLLFEKIAADRGIPEATKERLYTLAATVDPDRLMEEIVDEY